jgi:hypothetical protein
MSNKPAPQERILPMVLGYWQARALAVATEVSLRVTVGPIFRLFHSKTGTQLERDGMYQSVSKTLFVGRVGRGMRDCAALSFPNARGKQHRPDCRGRWRSSFGMGGLGVLV